MSISKKAVESTHFEISVEKFSICPVRWIHINIIMSH